MNLTEVNPVEEQSHDDMYSYNSHNYTIPTLPILKVIAPFSSMEHSPSVQLLHLIRM